MDWFWNILNGIGNGIVNIGKGIVSVLDGAYQIGKDTIGLFYDVFMTIINCKSQIGRHRLAAGGMSVSFLVMLTGVAILPFVGVAATGSVICALTGGIIAALSGWLKSCADSDSEIAIKDSIIAEANEAFSASERKNATEEESLSIARRTIEEKNAAESRSKKQDEEKDVLIQTLRNENQSLRGIKETKREQELSGSEKRLQEEESKLPSLQRRHRGHVLPTSSNSNNNNSFFDGFSENVSVNNENSVEGTQPSFASPKYER